MFRISAPRSLHFCYRNKATGRLSGYGSLLTWCNADIVDHTRSKTDAARRISRDSAVADFDITKRRSVCASGDADLIGLRAKIRGGLRSGSQRKTSIRADPR